MNHATADEKLETNSWGYERASPFLDSTDSGAFALRSSSKISEAAVIVSTLHSYIASLLQYAFNDPYAVAVAIAAPVNVGSIAGAVIITVLVTPAKIATEVPAATAVTAEPVAAAPTNSKKPCSDRSQRSTTPSNVAVSRQPRWYQMT